MKGGAKTGHVATSQRVDGYEYISRIGRWFGIVSIGATFPQTAESTPFLYALLAAYSLFNIGRYNKFMMQQKWFRAPLATIVIDALFASLLALLVGTVHSPYMAVFVFAIIQAAYRYGTPGVAAVVSLQTAWIAYVKSAEIFPPMQLTFVPAVAVAGSVLYGIGFYAEGLTRHDRRQRDELERLSKELEAGRKHLLTLVDSLNDAIFVVDDHGRVTDYNRAAASLCEDNGLSGKAFAKVLKLNLRVDYDSKPVNLLSQSGAQHRRDLCKRLGTNESIDLDITVQPVRLEGKRTADYIIVCKDITKERSLDEERTEFISVASHELRAPISIMEAALSATLIAKDKMDAQTREILQEAHRHSQYLGKLVKDLSIMAEANNDNLPIKLEKVDPAKIVRQLGKDFTSQAKQKNLELRVVVDKDTPSVLTTESHVREILQNYLTNAIKYTNEGQVILRVEGTSSGGVKFSVHDSGIGLSAADQKHLFTKFFRSEDFRTRQTGGTGLGLYLCREIAMRLNGKVWCESELNKGSIFFLEIPSASRLSRDQKDVIDAEVANLVQDI